jgi:hypothetical protein
MDVSCNGHYGKHCFFRACKPQVYKHACWHPKCSGKQIGVIYGKWTLHNRVQITLCCHQREYKKKQKETKGGHFFGSESTLNEMRDMGRKERTKAPTREPQLLGKKLILDPLGPRLVNSILQSRVDPRNASASCWKLSKWTQCAPLSSPFYRLHNFSSVCAIKVKSKEKCCQRPRLLSHIFRITIS